MDRLTVAQKFAARAFVHSDGYHAGIQDLSVVTFSELTQLVAGFLLDSNPPHDDLRINANQQTQLDAVIKLLPRLQYGLDVNVRFNNVRGFEFTEEMAAFDMTGITLLHGWILDPEDKHTAAVIDGISYNKLVEKLLDFRSISVDERKSAEPDVCAVGGTSERVANCGSADKPSVQAARVAEGAALAREDMVRGDGLSSESISLTDDELETKSNATSPQCAESAVIVTKVGTSGEVVSATSVSPRSMEREGEIGLPDTSMGTVTSEKESMRVATTLKEGQVAEEFFRETASQLTYYGLSRLHQEVRERQLCVFFRNNHFSSMFKFEGRLYLLITDLGYARESSVVWEKLDQIDGDTEYVDSDFTRSSRCSPVDANLSAQLMGNQHDDQDYMLALALQQEDATSRDSASGPTSRALSVSHPPTSTRSRDHLDQNQSLRVASGDEAVALALHQKEQALFEQWERPRQASPSPFPVESQPEPGRDELIRQPHVERRAPRDRDRRRQAEAARGRRSESGVSCSIQ